MSNDITSHEEQQYTILQLMELLETQTETIARLESYSLSIQGFAELEANLERGPIDEVERPAPGSCMVLGDDCINLYLTPCMHIICAECAENWFVTQGKPTCPMCRYDPISVGDLVQCPMPRAQAPPPDRQLGADDIQCQLAEYRSLMLQVETKLELRVAPFFCTLLLEHLRQQVSGLELVLRLGREDENTAMEDVYPDIVL